MSSSEARAVAAFLRVLASVRDRLGAVLGDVSGCSAGATLWSARDAVIQENVKRCSATRDRPRGYLLIGFVPDRRGYSAVCSI